MLVTIQVPELDVSRLLSSFEDLLRLCSVSQKITSCHNGSDIGT